MNLTFAYLFSAEYGGETKRPLTSVLGRRAHVSPDPQGLHSGGAFRAPQGQATMRFGGREERLEVEGFNPPFSIPLERWPCFCLCSFFLCWPYHPNLPPGGLGRTLSSCPATLPVCADHISVLPLNCSCTSDPFHPICISLASHCFKDIDFISPARRQAFLGPRWYISFAYCHGFAW